jgi:hypothetical protein
VPYPSPPSNLMHPCQGCALEEARGGRVCPAAHAYGLPDVEAQRHAAALHAAILADPQRLPGFAELVRRDAITCPTGALPASLGRGLLEAHLSDPATHGSAKEVVYAFPSRAD